MKISIDGIVILELNKTQEKIICNDVKSEDFFNDCSRRIEYVINHKWKMCMERLKIEWIPKLKEAGIDTIPIDDEKLAELIFSQPDYKDRTQREFER